MVEAASQGAASAFFAAGGFEIAPKHRFEFELTRRVVRRVPESN
jgi:hypothetical protein